jgi:hypothetical protein
MTISIYEIMTVSINEIMTISIKEIMTISIYEIMTISINVKQIKSSSRNLKFKTTRISPKIYKSRRDAVCSREEILIN